ncbi:MAG: SDR family oxidoreductase [archaeon]|nr:SDR family oxidoreductase [archaeon]
MRVLITGASGFIGFKLAKLLLLQKHVVTGTFSSNKPPIEGCHVTELDVTDKKMVSRVFSMAKPEVVFHLSAITNVDLCEKDKGLALRVNVDGTRNIAGECEKNAAKMVFASTSAVFGGKKTFFEDSDYCPANFYGETKMLAEKIIKKDCRDFVIARTDHPYGWRTQWQKDNSVTRNLKKFADGLEVKDVVDWFNTPTYSENLVKALAEATGKKLGGVFHFSGPDFLNRYELAVKTAKAFGFDPKMVKKMQSSEMPILAKRQNCRLDNKKTLSCINTEFWGVDKSLKHMAGSASGADLELVGLN